MAQGVEQVRARTTAARGAEQGVEYVWRGEAEHQESKTGGTNVGHNNARTRMGEVGERYVPRSSDRPGGARWRRFGRRVWNSTNVHHTTRMRWCIGGGAEQAGQREAEGVLSRIMFFENARTHEMGDAS